MNEIILHDGPGIGGDLQLSEVLVQLLLEIVAQLNLRQQLHGLVALVDEREQVLRAPATLMG
jgi:hypothetical protein